MQHSMILAELISFDHSIVPILMMKDSLLKRQALTLEAVILSIFIAMVSSVVVHQQLFVAVL